MVEEFGQATVGIVVGGLKWLIDARRNEPLSLIFRQSAWPVCGWSLGPSFSRGFGCS
jgi:hypothetical protein